MSFQNCKIAGVGVNPEAYHGHDIKRGDPNHPVSPSLLREFARCPARWLAGYESPESKSKAFGSLFDCLALTPDQLTQRYVCQPETYTTEKDEVKPWTNLAKLCKQWRDDQLKAGMTIVKKEDLDEAYKAVSSLLSDLVAFDWHKASDKQVLVEGQWQDEASGLTVPVRCLIDYAPRKGSEFEHCLGDLKTTYNGELRTFTRNAYLFGYHVQAAFDTILYNEATGDARDKWCLVGVESFPPYQSFKRMFDAAFLDIGKQTVDTLLRLYCRCLSKNDWPGYDDSEDAVQGWSIMSPLPWMQYDALGDKMASLVNGELTPEQAIERAGL